MNEQFAAMSKSGCFATALVTTFFSPTNELSLCNAGHPPPLLYRAGTKQWSYLVQRTPSIKPLDHAVFAQERHAANG